MFRKAISTLFEKLLATECSSPTTKARVLIPGPDMSVSVWDGDDLGQVSPWW